MMVLRSSPWSLPWEKVILMMLLTPFGVDLWNTLLYHLEALQLSFSPFFLCSFPTLSEGYNTVIAQTLPAGLILLSTNGVQVATDRFVFVPAGSADGYGMATVPAHVLTSGVN